MEEAQGTIPTVGLFLPPVDLQEGGTTRFAQMTCLSSLNAKCVNRKARLALIVHKALPVLSPALLTSRSKAC